MILAAFAVFSCDNNGKNVSDGVLEGSQWKVLKIVDKETAKETIFPSDAKNFEMIFRTDGKLRILNGCNMYCQPISDFEDLFVRVLKEVKAYRKAANQLILSSDKNDIVLEYVGKYDLTQGKVLFCTNIHILNCISEIEITIDGKKVGKIDAGSQYNDRDMLLRI